MLRTDRAKNKAISTMAFWIATCLSALAVVVPATKAPRPVPLQAQINIQHFERLIFEDLVSKRRSSLSVAGPVFEYDYSNHAWGYQRHGCLIGGEGEVYAYDSETAEAPARINTMDLPNYQRARELAVSLGQKGFESELELKHVMYDAGEGIWSVVTHGEKIALKEIGNFAGELTDPRATELVGLISKWCPAAAGASILR